MRSIVTNTVVQLPVQRNRAAAFCTSGSRCATSAQSFSVTARSWTRNASGAYCRTSSIDSGSQPPCAGNGLRTPTTPGIALSGRTMVSAPILPRRPLPMRYDAENFPEGFWPRMSSPKRNCVRPCSSTSATKARVNFSQFNRSAKGAQSSLSSSVEFHRGQGVAHFPTHRGGGRRLGIERHRSLVVIEQEPAI